MTDCLDLSALTDLLADTLRRRHQGKQLIIGLSGAQGSGKSTLAASLREALTSPAQDGGLGCLILALDDFYLTRTARQNLATKIHPLCETRGVPGTHDVVRLSRVLADLGEGKTVRLPQFNKTSDERAPRAEELIIDTPPDIVLLEGWCVGARPMMLASAPATDWEKAQDPEAAWKSWTHNAARDYEAVWNTCDLIVQLRQSDFNDVIDARWLQEQGNAARSGRWQFQSRDAVAEFCAHYESWTKALWRHLPNDADIIIDRAADFTYRINNPTR